MESIDVELNRFLIEKRRDYELAMDDAKTNLMKIDLLLHKYNSTDDPTDNFKTQASKPSGVSSPVSDKRSPADMLRPEFKGLGQLELLKRIFGARPNEILDHDTVAKIAYATESQQEFVRARGSISASLRTQGIETGILRKVGKGKFIWNGDGPKSPEY
jgi:hypothetical protein